MKKLFFAIGFLAWVLFGVAVQYHFLESKEAATGWPWAWDNLTESWLYYIAATIIGTVFGTVVFWVTRKFGYRTTSSILIGATMAYLFLPKSTQLLTEQGISIGEDWWKQLLLVALSTIVWGLFVYGTLLLMKWLVESLAFLWQAFLEWRERRHTAAERKRAATNDVHDKAAADQERRKALFASLPSTPWFKWANTATACCMAVSLYTTALGFYTAMMDPYDPEWLKLSVSTILSAAASLVIWVSWYFVYREMRLAESRSERNVAVLLGLLLVVPLTICISTAFGTVGVGGTEAQRIDHNQHIDVLDVGAQLALSGREAEKRVAPDIEFLRARFEEAALVEERGGSGCGGGRGDLWRFHNARQAELGSVLNLIKQPVDSAFVPEIEAIRADIRDPGMAFEEAMEDIGVRMKQLRQNINSVQAGSTLSTLDSLNDQLALVGGDEFFEGWSECQIARKGQIRAEVATMQESLAKVRDRVQAEIEANREAILERVGHQSRFVGLETGDVPEFYPLDKFWAVVNYWNHLPGYIALQFGIDLSPFIFCLLFFFLAPVSMPGTRRSLQRANTNPDAIHLGDESGRG